MSAGPAVPNGVWREEAQLLKEAIIMVRKQNRDEEIGTAFSGKLAIAGKLPRDPDQDSIKKRSRLRAIEVKLWKRRRTGEEDVWVPGK